MKIPVIEEMTLLDALALAFPEASKTTLRGWIKEERVVVDEEPVKKDMPVHKKNQIMLRGKSRYLDKVKILFEDKHIVVVEKPVGLLSVDTNDGGSPNVHGSLRKHFGNVWPVQRLDRETSGVMVFALSKAAKEHLKRQFMHHTIYREYFAIVEGRMEGSGTWKSEIMEDPTNLSVRSKKGGELAITHYKVLEASNQETHLQLILDTGKKHQIRVHTSEAGHPVLGDKRYGSNNLSRKRLALHAHKLGFIHPITQKKLHFISPKPFR